MKIKVDIHADDYGYSLATSRDILECVREEKLDSISIICNTPYFEESMELFYESIPSLKYLPLMSVHLNLPEGIMQGKTLPLSWGKLFLSSFYFGREKRKKEIKAELKYQMERGQQAIDRCISIAKENGIPCKQKGMRLDSHVHTHLIPVVWDALIEVIEEENVPLEFLRNPKEPIRAFIGKGSLFGYGLTNILKNRILMALSVKADRYLEKRGIARMYMWGLMMSGHMDKERVKAVFPKMLKICQEDDRNLEILFHPGMALDEEYDKVMNPDYFRDFNSSKNRHIEKEAVMKIREIIEK